jgi:hypothetical protein
MTLSPETVARIRMAHALQATPRVEPQPRYGMGLLAAVLIAACLLGLWVAL